MQKGSIVEFKHKSQTKAGVLDSPEGKSSWVIQDERGQSYTIAQRDVVFTLPGHTVSQTHLAAFLQRSQDQESRAELELAWELLEGEKTVKLEDLCNLMFSEVTPEGLWATRQVLARDRIFFKEKNDLYEVRDRIHAQELKRALEAEESRNQASKEMMERWNRKRSGEHLEWTPEDLSRLEALKALVIHGEEATGKNLALKTLELFDRPGTPEGAFRLLVEQKVWDQHENLGIHRRGIETAFNPGDLDEVRKLITQPPEDPDASLRRDFTRFRVFTIDSDSTVEIDDGLSLETLPDGSQKIWVHIADPGRLISLDTPVDALARRRGTSFYLPTGMIPMLPLELTAGPLSLNKGQTTPALSFGVTLEEDGRMKDFEITPSLITPSLRLTYQEADALLEEGSPEPDLAALSALARKRTDWRTARGASTFRLPEIEPVVKDGDIQMVPVEDTPSRQLVSEMMILAGEAAGTFGGSRALPLPYRGQATPEGDMSALELVPEGPARDYARRRMMPRSSTMTSPVPHFSLGLEAYVQVTSPLRRYNDLLAHYQIKALLRGQQAPLDVPTMDAILPQTQEASGMAAGLERETDKYWYLEYLRRRQGETFRAVVLGVQGADEKNYQIIFWDLGLEWLYKSSKPLQLGQEIRLKIKAADPRQERLVLTEG